jgi:hypothetical protein
MHGLDGRPARRKINEETARGEKKKRKGGVRAEPA